MLKTYVNKTPVVFPLAVLNKKSVKRFFRTLDLGLLNAMYYVRWAVVFVTFCQVFVVVAACWLDVASSGG